MGLAHLAQQIMPSILYVTGFGVILLTLFRRREYGLYFLAIIIPVVNVRMEINFFPQGKNLIDFVLLALVVSTFLFREQDSTERHFPQNKYIVLYVILTYVYLWWGSVSQGLDYPISLSDERFAEWKNHVICPLLYFLVLRNITSKRQLLTLGSLMLVTLLYAAYTFSTSHVHTSGHFRWDRRGGGTFVYLGPNETAAFFTDYVFIPLGVLLYSKSYKYRAALLVVVAYLTYAVLYSYSRGAYVAFLGGLCLVLWHRNKLLLIPLVVALASWQAILPDPIIERITMTQTEEGGLESSSAGRIQMWNDALARFAANPMGYGFGTISHLGFTNYRRTEINRDPHNRYVEFLVEMGIAGVALFCWLLYCALRSGWRLYKSSDEPLFRGLGLGFMACVAAMAITNLFGDRWTYVELAAYFWIFWAIVERAHCLVAATEGPTETSLATRPFATSTD